MARSISSDAENDRLRRERAVWLQGEITDDLANVVMAKLLFLEHVDRGRPVRLVLDSPGGSVVAALAVRDTGMAALLLCAGTPGMRHLCGEVEVHLGAVFGDDEGSGEVGRLREVLVDLYARCTGQELDWLRQALLSETRRLAPEEARSRGFVDLLLAALPVFPCRGKGKGKGRRGRAPKRLDSGPARAITNARSLFLGGRSCAG